LQGNTQRRHAIKRKNRDQATQVASNAQTNFALRLY
jgi:hypothetical protein